MKQSLYFLVLFVFLLLVNKPAFGQIEWHDTIDLEKLRTGVSRFWLHMIDDGMSKPIGVPIMVAKGKPGPVLGLTAAIHGNELNGIPVIHAVFDRLNIDSLRGIIVAVPGLNAISIPQHRRRYVDEEDLNRNFPGKAHGNRSQQYVWKINEKILSKLDYLIDMHTASFGRVNSLYVRGDIRDSVIEQMALLQDADILLSNKGIPSAAQQGSGGTRTMRAEAMLKGIPCITVEYGNPQVFQPDIIERGTRGVENVMRWLNMVPGALHPVAEAVRCKKSYWLFVDKGGYLEVPVALAEKVQKGQTVGILRNPFGDIIETYTSPEAGIVIGKSSNPVNMVGGRIIHLGILDE